MSSQMLNECTRIRRRRNIRNVLKTIWFVLAMPVSGITALVIVWFCLAFVFSYGVQP